MSSNVREGEEVRIPGGEGGYPRLDRVVPKGRSHCEARAHVYYVREGEEVRLPGGGGGYPRPDRAGGNPSPMVPYFASTYHNW